MERAEKERKKNNRWDEIGMDGEWSKTGRDVEVKNDVLEEDGCDSNAQKGNEERKGVFVVSARECVYEGVCKFVSWRRFSFS